MIRFSELFIKDTKKLKKRFPLIKNDVKSLIEELKLNPKLGTPLGNDLFKIRVPNSSIPTGKSGGFRVISYVLIADEVVLLRIYSKTDKENLSDNELKDSLKGL
jgi:mRNA-degrading endonuclease RelE of RelBE toxin-antitoxin system